MWKFASDIIIIILLLLLIIIIVVMVNQAENPVLYIYFTLQEINLPVNGESSRRSARSISVD